MAYKTASQEGPPSNIKSPEPEEAQKEAAPADAAGQDRKEPLGPAEEQFGYIVTNQR